MTIMEEIVRLENVSAYNKMRGVKTLHPLITVIDLAKAEAMPAMSFNFGLYAIYLKELNCGELKYGRGNYDFQEGTLVFVAPGQVLGVQPGIKTFEPKGWAMLFHPELVKGTSLGSRMSEYSFFSYSVNEALHLSEHERQIVLDCFLNIKYEMERSIDQHSKMLITSNIELLLNYCIRFYDRQFISRASANKGVLERFELLMSNYLSSDNPQLIGLPSVGYFADKVNLSPKYFGDLIKRETGISAQESIQYQVIDMAKEKISDRNKPLSEIAYELGFKYPQHFSRMFRKNVGLSPLEYRAGLS